MPKIYVAYRTDGEGAGQRVASGSKTTLRSRIGESIGSTWKLATYNIKPDVPTLCKMIENMVEMSFEGSLDDVRVNEVGQVRAINE